MSWTEEKVGLLRDCWGQGLSASQIADRLGDVTRNAVIGKAHRLGLDSRPSPIRTLLPGEQPRPRAPRKPSTRSTQRISMAKLLGGQVHRLNGHRPRSNGGASRADVVRAAAQHYVTDPKGPACKWPIGDPKEADFHFCTSQSAINRPYCPEHCAVAYIRKEQRHAA
ncbi:MAG: GcrA cell cycle regulator [Alphaproteobacteria bacterium]|nr:GcrA cell cycle regulator [Alphaproteobacteria bacterium]